MVVIGVIGEHLPIGLNLRCLIKGKEKVRNDCYVYMARRNVEIRCEVHLSSYASLKSAHPPFAVGEKVQD